MAGFSTGRLGQRSTTFVLARRIGADRQAGTAGVSLQPSADVAGFAAGAGVSVRRRKLPAALGLDGWQFPPFNRLTVNAGQAPFRPIDDEAHGIKRHSSSFNTGRIDHPYQDPHEHQRRLIPHYGDLIDSTNLIRVAQAVQLDEIYDVGAQGCVAVSF